MLIRMAIESIAVRSLERMLAHGELAPSQLEERQAALDEELAVPLFLIGMRGERAGNDLLFANFEAGKLSLILWLENQSQRNKREAITWWQRVSEFFAGSGILHSHAALLHFETGMIEAAKLPIEQRYHALADVDAAMRAEVASLSLARLLGRAAIKVAEAEQRVHSHIACAVAGLAVERFRLERGRWPESLDEVVTAGHLKRVPVDRFNGQPVTWRATADGRVVYAVGKDQIYDGTALDDLEEWNPNAIRTEFRLWDPAHRRQPPLVRGEPEDIPPP
jgi:hypothetical protein